MKNTSKLEIGISLAENSSLKAALDSLNEILKKVDGGQTQNLDDGFAIIAHLLQEINSRAFVEKIQKSVSEKRVREILEERLLKEQLKEQQFEVQYGTGPELWSGGFKEGTKELRHWAFGEVAFAKPFGKKPLVCCSWEDTGSGNDYMLPPSPIIHNEKIVVTASACKPLFESPEYYALSEVESGNKSIAEFLNENKARFSYIAIGAL